MDLKLLSPIIATIACATEQFKFKMIIVQHAQRMYLCLGHLSCRPKYTQFNETLPESQLQLIAATETCGVVIYKVIPLF